MPFDHLIPRPFTSNAVRMYAPDISGVYGISNANEWIFIGAADSIQGALLEHLRDGGTPIASITTLATVSWPSITTKSPCYSP